MKKQLLLAAVTLIAGSAFAYDHNEPDSYAQLVDLSPTPGVLGADGGDSFDGFTGLNFNYRGGADANRDESKLAYLYFNGELVKAVPSSNTVELYYNTVLTDFWGITFRKPGDIARMPGKYTVVFDEGLFLVGEDKTPSERVVLNYVIPEPSLVFTPTPGNDHRVLELGDITVTFTDAESVEVADGASCELYNIYGKPTASGEAVTLHPDMEAEGNVLTIYNDDPIKEAGSWRLTIPAGAVTINYKNGTSASNMQIDETWMIPEYSLGIPTPTPAEGDIHFFPAEIYLTVADGNEVDLVNGMGGNYIFPVNEDGTVNQSNKDNKLRYVASADPSDPHRVLLKSFSGAPVYLAPGRYALVTCDRLFRYKGTTSYVSALNFFYTIVPEEADCTIEPDEYMDVRSLKEFKVTFNNAQSVEVVADAVTFGNCSSDIATFQFWPVLPLEDGSKTITFRTAAPIELPGDYVFTAPSAMLKVDGEFVGVTANFHIVGAPSGVEAVQPALPEVFNVYAPDGRLVLSGADADSLAKLPAGIYIAGGRKVVVK